MTVRPAAFIASSTEGLEIAYALQQNLDRDLEATVWPQGVFRPGSIILDDVDEVVAKSDFGLFVFHPDDVVLMRGSELSSVRDNVILELGIFIGRLGRNRNFIVKPSGQALRVPTDLLGVNTAEYDAERSDGNWLAATGPTASAIRQQVRRLGAKRDRKYEGTSTARIKHWEVYDLTDSQQAADYYQTLSRTIRDAKHKIYRSGRGFAEIGPEQESQIRSLIEAERTALQNGVKVARIQTSRRASALWAEQYAALVEEFPRQLMVWADYSDPPLVNVAVVDPSIEDQAMVQLLFESHEFVITAERYKAATAIFLYGRSDIALSIERQFVQRVKELDRLNASDLRHLGAIYLYFAYGSNLSSRQMRKRCPGAEQLGVAVLYGWRLRFSVDAPHLGGATAGIEPSDDVHDHVWGVVWELTHEDKELLDAAEHGGYEPFHIDVKLQGQRDSVQAFTYRPVVASPEPVLPVDSYVEAMIEGAQENELHELLRWLRTLRAKRPSAS